MALTSQSAIYLRWSHRLSDRIRSLSSKRIESICGVGMAVQMAYVLTLAVGSSPTTENTMSDSWARWKLFVDKIKLLPKVNG